jgi:hypothetical protein
MEAMEPRRQSPFRRVDVRTWLTGLLVFLVVGFLVSSRWAKAKPATLPQPTPMQASGPLPPDGKYENVSVEGRVVPMVHVMMGGTVVLVDTDGKKPRSWEEQFKRKGDLPPGAFNVHKTNVNGSNDFADDPVDRVGLWVIDANANIVAR